MTPNSRHRGNMNCMHYNMQFQSLACLHIVALRLVKAASLNELHRSQTLQCFRMLRHSEYESSSYSVHNLLGFWIAKLG